MYDLNHALQTAPFNFLPNTEYRARSGRAATLPAATFYFLLFTFFFPYS
jgi:hypothetical protein